MEVKIFGATSKQAYDQLTSAISTIFNEELSIPVENLYVTYQEVENWGWNGNNF